MKIVSSLRSLVFRKPEATSTFTQTTDYLRTQLDKLESVGDAKRALKLFASEPAVVQRIDLRISQLADQLSLDQWVDVFNAKSVLRQRNVALLEICAYNIIKHATKNPSQSDASVLKLEHIQKCLLSCGILNYHDATFYTFLVTQLRMLLLNEIGQSSSSSSSPPSPSSSSSSSWIADNETHLLAIVNSLGMLQLRDEKMLDALASLLRLHPERVAKLTISFVQTCGALNYAPPNDFAQIVAALGDPVSSGHFNLDASGRDRHGFLNFVWSLCVINQANPYLIAAVLERKFFDAILTGFSKLY